jgi:hypothetical protein
MCEDSSLEYQPTILVAGQEASPSNSEENIISGARNVFPHAVIIELVLNSYSTVYT